MILLQSNRPFDAHWHHTLYLKLEMYNTVSKNILDYNFLNFRFPLKDCL